MLGAAHANPQHEPHAHTGGADGRVSPQTDQTFLIDAFTAETLREYFFRAASMW